MHKMADVELKEFICLICDETLLVAEENELVCHKCGNNDQQSFAPSEEALEEDHGSER